MHRPIILFPFIFTRSVLLLCPGKTARFRKGLLKTMADRESHVSVMFASDANSSSGLSFTPRYLHSRDQVFEQ